MGYNEKVLVFPDTLLDIIGRPNGYELDSSKLSKILNSDSLRFLPRHEAEEDTDYRQLIPYIVVKYQDKTLTYSRTKKSNEGRLQGKKSLGFGGHINPVDDSGIDSNEELYNTALCREMAEELVIEGPFTVKVMGVLCDDSNKVGRVHFGIVHLVNLQSDNIHTLDESIANVEFMTDEELANRVDEFENWSQLIIK